MLCLAANDVKMRWRKSRDYVTLHCHQSHFPICTTNIFVMVIDASRFKQNANYSRCCDQAMLFIIHKHFVRFEYSIGLRFLRNPAPVFRIRSVQALRNPSKCTALLLFFWRLWVLVLVFIVHKIHLNRGKRALGCVFFKSRWVNISEGKRLLVVCPRISF